MTTINTAIESVRNAIDNSESVNPEMLAVINGAKRLTADQRSAIEQIVADLSESAPVTMAEKLRKARENYVVGVSASGNKSAHTGDDVAQFLEAKPLADVLALADEFTPLDKGTHAQRYERLNIGSQRMNAGNKLRAAVKRGDIELTSNKDGEFTGFRTVS